MKTTRDDPDGTASWQEENTGYAPVHAQDARAVLRIDVRNHAGVMSHVVGLFARRACNLEGIVCLPTGDGAVSRIWLQLGSDDRLLQMTKFVANLEDVIAVKLVEPGIDGFGRLPELFPSHG